MHRAILLWLFTHMNLITVSCILNKTLEDNDDDTKGDIIIELVPDDPGIDTYDQNDVKWIQTAIINIGYYLRSHKFNEFDRRYYSNHPSENISNMFKIFPDPPLKYFHWDVFNQCKADFLNCLRYLYETVLDAYLQHSLDTVYVIKQQNLTLRVDTTKINAIEKECLNAKHLDSIHAEPFKGHMDRFQWRVTASYFMCWYTLLKTPELEHFQESCDNFASCLQQGNINNGDVRADDSIPFRCALYSFCPDPCCSSRKIVKFSNQCSSPIEFGNPCRNLNNKTCSFNMTLNESFTSIIYNQWNVTCFCESKAYEWNSRYGICIDHDECKRDNPCHSETENCSNFYGDYSCKCKFGYKWSNEKNSCVTDGILIRSLKRFAGINPDTNTGLVECQISYFNILLTMLFAYLSRTSYCLLL